jgi:hypothetical protein
VRPPLTRRDHLAGDQCSGTIKAMKERGWDRRPAALRRGPHDEGGASLRRLFLSSCLPFVPLFAYPCTLSIRRNRQSQPRSRRQQVPSCLAPQRNTENTESRSTRVPRSSALLRSKPFKLVTVCRTPIRSSRRSHRDASAGL